MPYHGKWDDMPEDLDDLQERIYDAYIEGLQAGRKRGGKEIAGKVAEWVKNRYMSREVKRKTPLADEILSLARDLGKALEGELSEVEEDPGEIRSKGKDLEKIERIRRNEL